MEYERLKKSPPPAFASNLHQMGQMGQMVKTGGSQQGRLPPPFPKPNLG